MVSRTEDQANKRADILVACEPTEKEHHQALLRLFPRDVPKSFTEFKRDARFSCQKFPDHFLITKIPSTLRICQGPGAIGKEPKFKSEMARQGMEKMFDLPQTWKFAEQPGA